MLQIPLGELEIEPGHVREWRLRPTAAAARRLDAERHRDTSFNQDKHLSAALDAHRENDPLASWVAATFELPGKADRKALEAALLYFVRRHEVLRCEFRQLADSAGCTTLAPDEVELDHSDIGHFDSTTELRDYMFEFFVKGIDTLGWPLIVMGAVERDTHTTVFLGYDHLVSDGMSSPIAVNDVAVAYAAYLDGREPELPDAGSYVEFGHAQRHRYGEIGADDPRLDYWRGFMERNGGFFPPFPLDLGLVPGKMYPTVNQTDPLMSSDEVAALESHCRAVGGRLSMAVLAAAAVALRDAGGPDVYRGLMPVSERGRGDWQNSMGWFVNTMPIEFSVAADLDFAQVLHGADAALREMLANADVPFVQAWRLLAPELADMRSWPYAVNFFSYIDFRRAVGGPELTARNAHKHVWASRSNGICQWFHRTPGGLFVNAIFADTPQAHATKEELHASLRATMTRMAHTGTL